jgi:hypothetical protein
VLEPPFGEIGTRPCPNFFRDVSERDENVRDDSSLVCERPRVSANEDSAAVATVNDDVVDGDFRVLPEGAREGELILRVKRAVVLVDAVRRGIRAGLRRWGRRHSENFLKRLVRVDEGSARGARHEDPDREPVGDGNNEALVQRRERRILRRHPMSYRTSPRAACRKSYSHLTLRQNIFPWRRASERPMAIACLRLVTREPEDRDEEQKGGAAA